MNVSAPDEVRFVTRTLTAVLAFALAAVSLVGTAVAQTFKDAICPEATQYVVAVGRVGQNEAPGRAYEIVQAAVDAYARCSKDKMSNGFHEAQHYADVRASGLAVIAARELVALKRYEDARRELLQWRPLAQQVVDWQSEVEAGMTNHRPNDLSPALSPKATDHRPSMYQASAKEIVSAIDAQLEEITQRTRDNARPQTRQAEPAATPAH